jgi:spore cortex formation protein SpoVR/YcgB (stage V sporulation)
MSKLLWQGNDWTFDTINNVYAACENIAVNELNLNCYPNSLEVITTEQMLDAYTSVGMPIYYKHWSFGKHFVQEQRNYQSGRSGLAYELVINSNPCINYLMEDNTMTTQALVIAHAAFGHNHFFKNNYLFQQWTDAGGIVDYLIFARDYIDAQEVKHGRKAVEDWLDSCHALMDYGVNRYKRPSKLSMEKEKARQKERGEYLQSQVSDLYRILPKEKTKENTANKFPAQPEENLLYFFEKYSPDLEDWQREILRIVRKIAQYFYPQGQTKVMNEGFASLVHYEIMNRLHTKGLTTDGSHLEFLALHTNVLYQPGHNSKYYSGINPYKFGFAMLQDITRMCDNPTEEDLHWFPQLKGANGWDVILDSVANFRDESFIRQWLSPKVIRDFKFFSVYDDREDIEKYLVTKIHNESGYEEVRTKLADQYLRSSYVPQIEVINVDRKTRGLTLQYTSTNNRTLGNTDKMMPHIKKLWSSYPVTIVDTKNSILSSM